MPDEAGIGATPARRANFATVPRRFTPAVSATILAALRAPQPLQRQQPGRVVAQQPAELALELVDPSGASADLAHQLAGDLHPGALLSTGELTGEPVMPEVAVQGTSRDLQLGPEVVQVPAQTLLGPPCGL